METDDFDNELFERLWDEVRTEEYYEKEAARAICQRYVRALAQESLGDDVTGEPV